MKCIKKPRRCDSKKKTKRKGFSCALSCKLSGSLLPLEDPGENDLKKMKNQSKKEAIDEATYTQISRSHSGKCHTNYKPTEQ